MESTPTGSVGISVALFVARTAGAWAVKALWRKGREKFLPLTADLFAVSWPTVAWDIEGTQIRHLRVFQEIRNGPRINVRVGSAKFKLFRSADEVAEVDKYQSVSKIAKSTGTTTVGIRFTPPKEFWAMAGDAWVEAEIVFSCAFGEFTKSFRRTDDTALRISGRELAEKLNATS